MTKLPLETEIDRENAIRAEALKGMAQMSTRINELETQLNESDEENSQLLIQLNAERKLRAEIATDLAKISEQFNKLIAS